MIPSASPRRLRSRARAPALGSPLLALLALALAPAACGQVADPPGRAAYTARPEQSLKRPGDVVEAPQERDAGKEADLPGRGAKIASIAMHTWIYVAPDDHSTKLGYFRAGAVVDRAEASAGTDGCAGGWYRVLPRGYVCVGKGASLSLNHQVVEAAVRGPMRDAPLPYSYVTSKSPPPHLYFRLASRAEQEHVEGSTLGVHLAEFIGGDFTAPIDEVPRFLADGRELPKPYGAEEKLHYSVHSGRAKEASAFGLITTFNWTGRRFGLTTELDMIPLDRTRAAKPSSFHGVIVTEPGTPAIVIHRGATKLREDDRGKLRDDGPVAFRSGWVLTGRNNGSEHGLVETTEGAWLAWDDLVVGEPRDDPQGFAASGKKWIDVSIKKQMLVAYEGRRAVYATLVSSGIGGMGDPATTRATVRGSFLIHAKHVSGTMDGDESTDSYELHDVPYIQYFFEGYALHAAFWHDDFGKPRSHGCINLAPADAAWLFEWTDPIVPPEWHGAVSAEGSTLIYTHG